MAAPGDIAAAFVAKALSVSGIANALDHEPSRLPTAPVVTMEPLLPLQEEVETGGGMDVTWRWHVRLYVTAHQLEQAQRESMAYALELYRVVRQDRRLNGTCFDASIAPRDDDLELETGERPQMIAHMVLSAETTET